MSIVQIGKTSLVAGLFWSPLSSVNTAKESRSIAREQSAKYFCAVDSADGKFAGFTNPGETCKPGSVPLALLVWASLRERIPKAVNVAVASVLPDGEYFYFCMRDGIIDPNGDFVGEEDEIRNRLADDGLLGDWDKIYAPAHWGYHASEDISVEEMLPLRKGRVVLPKAIRNSSLLPVRESLSYRIRKAAPWLISAAVLYGGVFAWREYQAAEQIKEMIRQQEIQAELNKPKPPPHPWATTPRSGEWVKSCILAMDDIPLAPGGWELVKLGCADAAMTATWRRPEYATIRDIRGWLPGVVIALDGESAYITTALRAGEAPVDEATADLPPAADVPERLYNFAQELRATVSLKPIAAVDAPPGSAEAASQALADWSGFDWKIVTGLDPRTVAKAADGPGVRIKSITAVIKDSQTEWTIEGVQYAKK